jgi:mannosyl-3-phosphoglycerate phosphatase
MKLIIFTDLDGTLLNHEDYSFEDAKPALNRIKKNNIPLIIVTSKTRKEVEILQKELDIEEPFIVENGGGIFFPKKYKNFKISSCFSKNGYRVVQLGKSYEEIRKFVEKIKDKFEVIGFGDMSVEDVMKYTGLPYEKAKLAKEREFTEPFLIKDESKIPQLQKLAMEEGIKITKGGRFYHFIGVNQDKGKAVELTIKIFQLNINKKIISVGLGDSQNDIPMLKKVNIPVLIKKFDGSYENVNIPNLIKAPFSGSKGWNFAVNSILDKYSFD